MTDGWQRARLIPVAGIKGDREAEQRATSAFLAVLTVARDLSLDLLGPLGASKAAKATVEAYTEVESKGSDGKKVRPDGLVRVSYGSRTWTTLVEVKTGSNTLDADQVNAYWDLARADGFDHVLTVSNELATEGAHPTEGLRVRSNSPVQVSHLSWMRILTTALRIRNHRGVDDPEQAWIVSELIRYLEHPASGVLQLDNMGPAWTSIRDDARAGVLSRRSEGLEEVVGRIDELLVYSALVLGSQIGEDVEVVHKRSMRDRVARLEAYARAISDGQPLVGTLRVPNTAGDIAMEIDLRAQQVVASVEVNAPEDRGARGRIGWLLGQLTDAPDKAVVDAYAHRARTPVSASLAEARDDRGLLLPDGKAEPVRFVVSIRDQMGLGRRSTARKPGFVDAFMATFLGFYEGVVQGITPWQPPAPKRVARASESEAEELSEGSAD